MLENQSTSVERELWEAVTLSKSPTNTFASGSQDLTCCLVDSTDHKSLVRTFLTLIKGVKGEVPYATIKRHMKGKKLEPNPQ